MSIVPASHLQLVRARKALEKSYREKDWDSVRQWDTVLATQLNASFEDGTRDTKALVSELERILYTYSNMLAELPELGSRNFLSPKTSKP